MNEIKKGELGIDEIHPAAQSALNKIISLGFAEMAIWLESFSSCAMMLHVSRRKAMDKLQKLLESKITYEINALDYCGGVYVTLRLKNNEEELCEQFLEIESAINWLWQAAKKHYPDAECFKEEK